MPEENQQTQVNAPENAQSQVSTTENNSQAQATASQTKEPNKIMGTLCYLGILFLIPMFVLKPEEKDSYILTHLRQGVGVFCIEFIGWLITFLAGILNLTFLVYIGDVFYLISFIFAVIGLINVWKLNSNKLPYVGDFFDKTFTFVK